MARDVNMVSLSGRLTRDPELRSTRAGVSVLGFTLASNDQRKNAQTGQWEPLAGYFDCFVTGPRADRLHAILRKGMKVSVAGRLRWSSWEDRETGRRSKVEVAVMDISVPDRGASPVPGASEVDISESVALDEIPF